MKRKVWLIIFILFFSGCKCRISNNPLSMPYRSITESKKNNAFIYEYQPKSPYLRMGGKDYYVQEAWVERPHYESDFRDILIDWHCLVIKFKTDTTDHTDLHSYVKEMGNGSAGIWFNLSNVQYNNDDTLVVYYKETLDSPRKNNAFLLFKKK